MASLPVVAPAEEDMAQAASRGPVPAAVDVVVVGAGFAGLYMLHRLRNQGLSAIAFDPKDLHVMEDE